LLNLQDFLHSLCQAAIKQLEEPSDKLILVLRSIMTSLGQIRFCSKTLIEKITNKMVEHESELQNKDLIAFLVATATLNYIPKNSEKLYEVDLLYFCLKVTLDATIDW
jgi:hypothetical protein